MTKLTRQQFIGILESGKYNKITGGLWDSATGIKSGKTNNCCAIGAVLADTGNVNAQPAKGYSYLPEQLVKDLDITPAFERKIFGLNDRTGDDNWKAVIEFLKKEWNISDVSEVNLYEAMQLLDGYYTEYYTKTEVKEDYGYNT